MNNPDKIPIMNLDQPGFLTSQLPLRLRLAIEQKRFQTPDGTYVTLDANVPIQDALLLYSLIREAKAATSLEIGFA